MKYLHKFTSKPAFDEEYESAYTEPWVSCTIYNKTNSFTGKLDSDNTSHNFTFVEVVDSITAAF